MLPQKPEFQNAIRVNHRGFLPSSKKRFVLTENKTGSLEFSVIHIDDVKYVCVYKGRMTPVSENGITYYEGDFSCVTKNGDYHIEAGGFKSRQLVIYDGAYDICQRTMLEYFTYQRCGHPLGWNGECHLDDGIIKETGERVDLNGGYHQSCDLRKSPGGVSIGVLCMLRFALTDKSQWGKILVRDEVKWACDYFVKTIQENGVMYNTLNDPFGWEGRVFYKSGAPSSAQWNVTSALTLGYMYFKDKEPALAQVYLNAALRSYKFMTGDARPNELYRHPDKYQMGMDPDFFYDQCIKNSTADIAYQITVSADLYRATGDGAYLQRVRQCAPHFVECIRDGYVLYRDDIEGKTVSSSCSYTWLAGGLFALCDIVELSGEYKDELSYATKEIGKFMDRTVWKTMVRVLTDTDLDSPCGHENKTLRQSIPAISTYGKYSYCTRDVLEPSYACYIGAFLARAASLLESEYAMGYAQAIADNLLGANVLDSSHIRAIGYNHPQHHAFGQFFPSTPFIPGAVGVGYHSIDVYETSSEYDMPCVGLSMYLLSLLK